MTPSLYVQGALTVLFGALAGGLTNAVAIWMLFHPYDARGVWRLKLQGAIPKNKARLARTIGRLVGQRLLTPEDLQARLAAPAVRAAFEDAVGGLVTRLLQTDLGSIRDTLPEPLLAELVAVVDRLGPALADGLARHAATPEFEERVRRFLERARDEVGDRPVAEVLTAARRAALRERIERWAEEAARSPDVERAVRHFVHRQLVRMAEDRTPLLDRLPTGLVAALERGIADYLPVALERLGAALADPATRGRAIRSLRELLDRATRDLLLHERIVAKLVVTERTVERVIAGLEAEGVVQLGSLLEDQEVRAQVARAINDAVVRFLRTPLAERLASLEPERREALERAASEYILSALRDGETRARILDALERALEQAEQRTWGDLLAKLPPERAARWLGDALGGDRARQWTAEAVTEAATALLDRPIGRPVDVLPAESLPPLTASVSAALWTWTQEQIPGVVAQLGVPEIVEEKVLGFSLERLEELIRGVTQRELDLIVRLGYVLGGIVGALAFLVNVAVR